MGATHHEWSEDCKRLKAFDILAQGQRPFMFGRLKYANQ
jgi:hypothetical protein